MMTQTAPNDRDLDQMLLDNAILVVSCEAQDLAECGYTGQELLDEIIAFNQTQSPPLSAEHLQPILDKYNPAIINKKRIEAAIANKDVHALEQCLPYIAIVQRRSFSEYTILYNLIHDAFKGKLNFKIFNSALKAEVRKQEGQEKGKKPDVADIAQVWAGQWRDTWGHDGQRFHMYDEQRCFWIPQSDKVSELTLYAKAAIQEHEIAVNTLSGVHTFKEFAALYCKREFTPVPYKVNFADGALNTITMQMERHDRENNFTYCLPYCYDPHGTCPRINTTLREIIPDRYRRQAYKIHIGLALLLRDNDRVRWRQ